MFDDWGGFRLTKKELAEIKERDSKPDPAIDTTKLGEISQTLLNLLTRVFEVTVLTVNQDDVEKICEDVLDQQEKIKRLEGDLEEAKGQTFEAMIEKAAKVRVDAAIKKFEAARQGERDE